MNRNFTRPVTIASVCGPNGSPELIFALAEQAAKQKPDLILLHECWHSLYDLDFEEYKTYMTEALNKMIESVATL